MMLNELLSTRRLPPLLQNTDGSPVTTAADWRQRRADCLNLLLQEEYGVLPPLSFTADYAVEGRVSTFGGGKGTLSTVKVRLHTENGDFSFPFSLLLPTGRTHCPAFLILSFRKETPNPYWPAEEICEEGFAAASFCYTDVTADNDDFTDGLARLFYPDGKRSLRSAGKLMLWAFAASRVMDYLINLKAIDPDRVAVIGHSRLGKTALLASALDERFFLTVANESGCGGAAVSRGKVGESLSQICQTFPFWFAPQYASYADREEALPFDQHTLNAMTAPRFLYIASAKEDLWADPTSEFLGGAALDEVYALYGRQGLCHEDRLPQPDELLHQGSVGYHMRPGDHFLKRDDWKAVLRFFRAKL